MLPIHIHCSNARLANEETVSILEELRPNGHARVYDLVQKSGVDVAEWEAGKVANAAANPNFCFNWAFVQHGRVVVLCLWHEEMTEVDGVVSYSWDVPLKGKHATVVRRIKQANEAIREAFESNLPLRIIVCRSANNGPDEPRRVAARCLDPEPWHVECRLESGAATLRRGAGATTADYEDQFDLAGRVGGPTERIERQISVFMRRANVRRHALNRSQGRCEYCGQRGFGMGSGKIYLETHHIIPLYENGEDSSENVIALCPNHHREAHYGEKGDEMRNEMLRKIATVMRATQEDGS